jgi:hypothetical protein
MTPEAEPFFYWESPTETEDKNRLFLHELIKISKLSNLTG